MKKRERERLIEGSDRHWDIGQVASHVSPLKKHEGPHGDGWVI